MSLLQNGQSRHVPFLLKCQVLFGGWESWFGWLFFGLGLIFFWIFTLNADVSFLTMRGNLKSAEGVLSRSERTKASEGGTNRSKRTPIYANYYSFNYDGKRFKGVSYATGGQLRSGAPVMVEFVAGNPTISRIKGMRRAAFGPGGLVAVIFPSIGLGFLLFGMKKGFKAARLLSDGVLAYGTLKSKTDTATQYNRKSVCKMVFDFPTEDGQIHQITTRTSEPEKLEDDKLEPLLYRRCRPSEAITLDDLPGSPQIDEMGRLKGGSIKGFFGALAFPALTLLGHGTYLLFRFQR